jgi:hypothetical protein
MFEARINGSIEDKKKAEEERNSSQAALEKVATDGRAVLTTKGQPTVLMLQVDGHSLENTLYTLFAQDMEHTRFLDAIRGMQLTSLRNGTSNMTMEETTPKSPPTGPKKSTTPPRRSL